MDDPEIVMPCFVGDSISPIKMSKVYHIHLILKLSPCCKDKNPTLKHYRLILNRKGIKRLEELGLDSQIENTHNYPPPIPNILLVEPEDITEELEVPLAHTSQTPILPNTGDVNEQ